MPETELTSAVFSFLFRLWCLLRHHVRSNLLFFLFKILVGFRKIVLNMLGNYGRGGSRRPHDLDPKSRSGFFNVPDSSRHFGIGRNGHLDFSRSVGRSQDGHPDLLKSSRKVRIVPDFPRFPLIFPDFPRFFPISLDFSRFFSELKWPGKIKENSG